MKENLEASISKGKSALVKKKKVLNEMLIAFSFFNYLWKRQRGNGDKVQKQNWIAD